MMSLTEKSGLLHRVEALGGTLAISSHTGEWTSVDVEIFIEIH
jgi:signal transduction histidine kinase